MIVCGITFGRNCGKLVLSPDFVFCRTVQRGKRGKRQVDLCFPHKPVLGGGLAQPSLKVEASVEVLMQFLFLNSFVDSSDLNPVDLN